MSELLLTSDLMGRPAILSGSWLLAEKLSLERLKLLSVCPICTRGLSMGLNHGSVDHLKEAGNESAFIQ
jgi:hypothetical protein